MDEEMGETQVFVPEKDFKGEGRGGKSDDNRQQPQHVTARVVAKMHSACWETWHDVK